MTVWAGWDTQLLSQLDAQNTGANRSFVGEWAKADGTACARNPLAATVPLADSTNCKQVTGAVYVQAYSTHAHAVAATTKQLEEPPFAPILAALKTGNPFTYANWQEVVGALGTWGAHAYAVQYGNEAQAVQGRAGGGGTISSDASRSLAGYKHFSQQLSHTLPQQLHQAQQLRAQAVAHLRGKA